MGFVEDWGMGGKAEPSPQFLALHSVESRPFIPRERLPGPNFSSPRTLGASRVSSAGNSATSVIVDPIGRMSRRGGLGVRHAVGEGAGIVSPFQGSDVSVR